MCIPVLWHVKAVPKTNPVKTVIATVPSSTWFMNSGAAVPNWIHDPRECTAQRLVPIRCTRYEDFIQTITWYNITQHFKFIGRKLCLFTSYDYLPNTQVAVIVNMSPNIKHSYNLLDCLPHYYIWCELC